MTNYAGLDYGLGMANIDKANGIRYGVISQNSINLDYLSDFDSDYGDPHCPKCGNPVTDSNDFQTDVDIDNWEAHGCSDYVCESCKTFWDSGDCYPDECLGISYESGGYAITNCLDSDLMILKSPFYTFAQYCSPCVPGAGNLDNPCESGPKTYCLGHDWFDSGTAPYPVFSVADGSEVKP